MVTIGDTHLQNCIYTCVCRLFLLFSISTFWNVIAVLLNYRVFPIFGRDRVYLEYKGKPFFPQTKEDNNLFRRSPSIRLCNGFLAAVVAI